LSEAIVSHYFAKMNELLAKKKYSFSNASSKDVPKEPGIYAIFDARPKAVIYIGRTRNLRRRLLGDHKRGNSEGSQFRRALGKNFGLKSEADITNCILENCSFQFMVIKEFEDIVRLEHFTTAVLGPFLNTQLKQ
jgi:hypothetical protein